MFKHAKPATRTFSLLLSIGVSIVFCQAAEPQQGDASSATRTTPKDLYSPPQDGRVAALVNFIQRLREFQPSSFEELQTYQQRSPQALEQAALQILKLEKDPASDSVKLAQLALMLAKVEQLGSAKAAQRTALLDQLLALAKNKGDQIGAAELDLGIAAARKLERAGDDALAARAFQAFGQLIQGSANQQLADYAPVMKGAARRLTLVGKKIELKGTTVAGAEFDIAQCKGKVVLIDFWATWCLPCLAEFPAIRKNYEAYSAKGFDVVGVSLDRNQFALQKYLEENKVPWTTLSDPQGSGQPEAARHYGILTIPTMILVDKDGTVLSTRVDGAELGRLLKKQLAIP